jgi:hypothetical protein
MRILICLFSLAIMLSGCQPAKQEASSQQDTTTVAVSDAPGTNQLTGQQEAEGWKLLFNGRNMEGWRTFKNQENNSWEVADGTLHCKPSGSADKRADIITADQYANFELAFQWKIAPQANSGVIYRATEAFDRPYLSGPEYQLIDDKRYPGDLKPAQLTGSNYDMHAAPADKPLKPAGEWNDTRIVVNGNHVEHWLNGAKLIEYEFGSADWKKLKEGSKWKGAAGYGMAPSGHIDLQDHGGEVWFRNIMIKTL